MTGESPPPGWEDILDPGEKILWQGRPEARFDWTGLITPHFLPGIGITGFALFWMVMASGLPFGRTTIFNLFFMLFGLVFVFNGLNMAFGVQVRRWLRLRGSFYTLTDRNAFIATEFAGRRRLQRIPRDGKFTPVLEEGLPGSVFFSTGAPESGSWFEFDMQRYLRHQRNQNRRLGFEQIPEARRVFRLMLDPVAGSDGAAP